MNSVRLYPGFVLDNDITLVARIGEGSFAEVWSARASDGRRVAVKIDRSATASRHHLRESGRVRAVRHPNLVHIYGTTSIGARRCLVMEHVDGSSLQAEFEIRADLRAGLSVGETIGWSLDLASCLDELHGHGLTHRDIKPSNLIIEEATRRLVVLDLGLVHDNLSPFHDRTTSGRVVGSVPYMAPEQALGCAVTSRADAFAYTTVVFEMLFGVRAWVVGERATSVDVRAPLPLQDNGRFDVTARLVQGRRPRSHGLPPMVAARVDALLEHGWSPRPDDRPGSLVQWSVDLAFALRGTPVRSSLWPTSITPHARARHSSGVGRDTVDLPAVGQQLVRRAG
jgi:serine/threonine protein kinase